jgi:hypothetical protein
VPFEEVVAVHPADPISSVPGDGPPVVMLDGSPPAPEDPGRAQRRPPFPRVLAALVLGAVAGAAGTYALEHRSPDGLAPGAIQVRLDSEALAQGLDVYGLRRPALPLLITNRETTVVRVAELTWASPDGRLVWYGDAAGVDPGQQARIWGESRITCGRAGGHDPALYAYVLLPGGPARTVEVDDPGSIAVFHETVQRACS